MLTQLTIFLKCADLPYPEKREYRAVLALYELRA